MAAKRCNKCGVVKPLTAFGKHPHNKDGRKGSCKMCVADYMREYRQANPEKYQRERLVIEARRQALEALAVEFAGRFAELVDEKRGELGLPPVGAAPAGRAPNPWLAHGTAGMYQRGCRCDPCVAYHRSTARRSYQRRRAS